MKHLRLILLTGLICIFCTGFSLAASANDLNTTNVPTNNLRAPSSESDVDNLDGTWTFTQVIDEDSTAPHYVQPASGGFEIYTWFDEDYGWMHDFPHWNTADLNILSATLTIVAWDVDSDVDDGEFDGVSVDGVILDPSFLQGTDETWSVTTFDLRVSDIVDDGNLNVWLDIDMTHTEQWWATTVDYCELEIIYSTSISNQPPFAPELLISPACPGDDDDLTVTVVGPDPADPNGDDVTYVYRWFVDVTNDGMPGPFVDDEFAGRPDHTGNTVPAADTEVNDLWRVQVTPVDEFGAIGDFTTITWESLVGCYPVPTDKVSWD
ncbi:MAG: hypothetical protein GY780_08915, partial [bacterium]|nr:hypothetical protein [bacterium]